MTDSFDGGSVFLLLELATHLYLSLFIYFSFPRGFQMRTRLWLFNI